DLAASHHLKAVLDDATLVAGARHDRPPARLRPGDDGDMARGKIAHDMAVAAQRLGAGDDARHRVGADLAAGERWERVEIELGEVREHWHPPFVSCIMPLAARCGKWRLPSGRGQCSAPNTILTMASEQQQTYVCFIPDQKAIDADPHPLRPDARRDLE